MLSDQEVVSERWDYWEYLFSILNFNIFFYCLHWKYITYYLKAEKQTY
jgi:hypothetical protein